MTDVTTTPAQELVPVYCRSCRAHLGFRYGNNQHGLFCTDPICPCVPPTRENADEERNGILVALAQTGEYTREQLAALAGISRQRITQLVKEMRDGSARELLSPVPRPRATLRRGG